MYKIMSKKTLVALLCCASLGLSACNDDNDQEQLPTRKRYRTNFNFFCQIACRNLCCWPDSGAYVKGANGIYPPFKGQPVQGFSAALKNEDGSYMAMADNGFGTQDNSSDFLLRIYKLKPDFKTKAKGTGQVTVQSFIHCVIQTN